MANQYNSWNSSAQKDYRYTALDAKAINQSIIKNLLNDARLSIFNKQTEYNGIIQYIRMGLISGKDFEREIKISDFNPADPKMKQIFYGFDTRKKYTYQLDSERLMQSTSNRGMRKTLQNEIAANADKSISYDLFKERMKIMLTQKLTVNGVLTSFDVDKTEKVGDMATETKTKSALAKIRLMLENFKTPGQNHTKFTRDNKADKYVDEFQPSDFKLYWNSKYYNKLGDLTATLFNKNDILFDVGTREVFDFDTIADDTSYGFTNAEKTAAKKIVGVLFHEKAIMELYPDSGLITTATTPTLNMKTIHETFVFYGHYRLAHYPFVLITE